MYGSNRSILANITAGKNLLQDENAQVYGVRMGFA